MNEQEFDSLRPFRRFERDDLCKAEQRAVRATALSLALWGRHAEHLEHQLNRSHPEIPAGFELSDFLALQEHLEFIGTLTARSPLGQSLNSHLTSAPDVTVGNQRFTAWQARYEIVRRAIAYLK